MGWSAIYKEEDVTNYSFLGDIAESIGMLLHYVHVAEKFNQ
jgi:hypothetical protein